MNFPPDDVYLTTHDVCILLGIAKSTAERWRSSGNGPPHIKMGPGRTSPVRYARSAVLSYLTANQKSSTSNQ